MDLGSGLYGIDTSGTTDIVDTTGVLPDVSQGAPDMSPSTPAGNGTGYTIDPSIQSTFADTLKTGLNFVLQRDAQQMNGAALPYQAQANVLQYQTQKLKSSNMFMLLAAGVALLFVLGGKH